MIKLANINIVSVIGKLPPELITFFHPSIEYLNSKKEGKEL